MATIYIRDQLGQEYITEQLKIASGRLITPDMLIDTTTEEDLQYMDALKNLDLSNLNIGYMPGMVLSSNIINAITLYIEKSIQSLIADNAEQVLEKLGINKETLDLTNKILNIIDKATFKINSILKFIPKNIKTVPAGNAITSSICTSLKDMYMAIWLNLQIEYYETINDAILSIPPAQEALQQSIDALKTLAENIISQQIYQYTGKTLVELKYMCQKVIDTYEKYKKKKEQARRGIDEITKTSITFDAELFKQQLKEQLAESSDLVYNSFFILQIKESIDNIIQLVNEFNNIDLNSLAEGINTFDDFMNLLEEMGINDKSNVITLKETMESGINYIRNNYIGLTKAFATQALSTAQSLAEAAVSDVSIHKETTFVQNFSLNLEVNTNTLFIIFDKEPVTKHIIKNLSQGLIRAENDQHERIFNANQVQQILNLIDQGVFFKKDQEMEIGKFNIIIKFNLDDYNKGDVKTVENQKTAYEMIQMAVDDYYKRLDEIKQAKEQEYERELKTAMDDFQMGVVTEEFTADPVMVKKRPTMQIVHELFSILQEIFPLLKLVTTLMSNYKINKKKVQENAQGNIFGMIRFLAKVNNLMLKLNKNNKNFFTVRTLRTYHFINNKIKAFDTSRTDMELNLDETKLLYNFLVDNNMDTSEINLDFDTVLYLDIEQINEQQDEFKQNVDIAANFFGEDVSLFVQYPDSKYNDGTFVGLDKIKDAGTEIYYSNSTLPVNPSQILIAYGKNLDVSI